MFKKNNLNLIFYVLVGLVFFVVSGCDIFEGKFTWVYEPDCNLTPQRLKVWAECGRMNLTLRNDTGTDVRAIEGDSEQGNNPIWFEATGTDEPLIFSQSKFPDKMSVGEVATVEDTSGETFTNTEVYDEVTYRYGYDLACEKKKPK